MIFGAQALRRGRDVVVDIVEIILCGVGGELALRDRSHCYGAADHPPHRAA